MGTDERPGEQIGDAAGEDEAGADELAGATERVLGSLSKLRPPPRPVRDPTSLYQAARIEMCEEAGRLQRVRYGRYPDAPSMVWVVRLTFARGDWSLVAVPDDDSLMITAELESDHCVFADAPEDSPWHAVLGRSPLWIWTLTNQQGYVDGIQFEFNLDDRRACQIQMLVLGSRWQIRELPDP